MKGVVEGTEESDASSHTTNHPAFPREFIDYKARSHSPKNLVIGSVEDVTDPASGR